MTTATLHSDRRHWRLRMALVVVALSLVLVHTAFTLFMNLPANYVFHQNNRLIAAYMLPYFSQSWSLFAPNPGGGNPTVAFRFTYPGANGTATVTPWMDGNSLFAGVNSGNPLARLGLEREIYFGEVLIATNDIRDIRKAVAHHSTDRRAPIPIRDLPSPMLSVERIFMSLAPLYVPAGARKSYSVQVAMRDREPERFEQRFEGEKRKPGGTTATLVIPWVRGEYVVPFLIGAAAQ